MITTHYCDQRTQLPRSGVVSPVLSSSSHSPPHSSIRFCASNNAQQRHPAMNPMKLEKETLELLGLESLSGDLRVFERNSDPSCHHHDQISGPKLAYGPENIENHLPVFSGLYVQLPWITDDHISTSITTSTQICRSSIEVFPHRYQLHSCSENLCIAPKSALSCQVLALILP